MEMFAYKGIGADGLLVRGAVEAETIDEAQDSLIAKGFSVLTIRKTHTLLQGLGKSPFGGKTARRDVIEFVRSMGTMLRAGIPLLDALEDMEEGVENKNLKNAIHDIKERIVSGSTLSEALGAQARIFPDMLVRMVKVGEETGRVERSFSDMGDHLQRVEDLVAMVKRALMYPLFVLTVTGGALVFWIVYVMPKLLSAISEMGLKMPLMTRIMLWVSDTTRSYWYVMVLLVAAFFVALRAAKRNEKTRYFYDSVKLRLPIVRLFVINKCLASFAEQMKMMVVAGITVDRCLDIVSSTLDSEVFRRALLGIKERILAGSRVSEAMRAYAIFPRLTVRLIDVGESSGSLGEQFSFLSDHYFKRLDEVSEQLGRMLEPILMTIVGVLFAVIIMAALLPIYDVVLKFK